MTECIKYLRPVPKSLHTDRGVYLLVVGRVRSKNGLSEWVGASLNEEGDSGEIRIAALASISGI